MITNFQRSLIGVLVAGVCVTGTLPALAASRGERGTAGSSGTVSNGTSRASVSIQTVVNGEVVENIHHEEISRDGESVEVYEESHYATSSSESTGARMTTQVRTEAHSGGNTISPNGSAGSTTSTPSTAAVPSQSYQGRVEDRSRPETRALPPKPVVLKYEHNSSASIIAGISGASSTSVSTTPSSVSKGWWSRIKVFFYALFSR